MLGVENLKKNREFENLGRANREGSVSFGFLLPARKTVTCLTYYYKTNSPVFGFASAWVRLRFGSLIFFFSFLWVCSGELPRWVCWWLLLFCCWYNWSSCFPSENQFSLSLGSSLSFYSLCRCLFPKRGFSVLCFGPKTSFSCETYFCKRGRVFSLTRLFVKINKKKQKKNLNLQKRISEESNKNCARGKVNIFF